MSALPSPLRVQMATRRKRGGEACSAIGCTNARYKHNSVGLSFFRFPKDEARCEQWVLNARREDLLGKAAAKLYSGGYVLCSQHFESSQFLCPNELKKRLVWDAIPTIFNFPNNLPKLTVTPTRPPTKKRTSASLGPARKRQRLPQTEYHHEAYTHTVETGQYDAEEFFPSGPFVTPSHREMTRFKSKVKNQRFIWTNAGFGRMEQQNPVIKKEIVIDVGEESPSSHHMTEKFAHVSGREGFHTKSTAGIQMERTSEAQAVPYDDIGVRVKEEIDTDDTDSIRTEPKTEVQAVSCKNSGVSQQQKVSAEDRDSVQVGQMSEKDVGYIDDDVSPKQDISREVTTSIQKRQAPETKTMSCDDDSSICLNQEVSTVNTYSIQMEQKSESQDAPCVSPKQAVNSENTSSFQKEQKSETQVIPHDDIDVSSKQAVSAEDTCSSQMEQTSETLAMSCAYSGVWLKKMSSMNQIVKHAGPKPYVCEECNAEFHRSSGLKTHMLKHKGQKPYICPECNAKFYWSSGLYRHMLIHKGEKPHACQLCDMKFTQSGSLKRHMLVHTGQKPYVCEKCDATFARFDNLKTHMSIHITKKPHVCQDPIYQSVK